MLYFYRVCHSRSSALINSSSRAFLFLYSDWLTTPIGGPEFISKFQDMVLECHIRCRFPELDERFQVLEAHLRIASHNMLEPNVPLSQHEEIEKDLFNGLISACSASALDLLQKSVTKRNGNRTFLWNQVCQSGLPYMSNRLVNIIHFGRSSWNMFLPQTQTLGRKVSKTKAYFLLLDADDHFDFWFF